MAEVRLKLEKEGDDRSGDGVRKPTKVKIKVEVKEYGDEEGSIGLGLNPADPKKQRLELQREEAADLGSRGIEGCGGGNGSTGSVSGECATDGISRESGAPGCELELVRSNSLDLQDTVVIKQEDPDEQTREDFTELITFPPLRTDAQEGVGCGGSAPAENADSQHCPRGGNSETSVPEPTAEPVDEGSSDGAVASAEVGAPESDAMDKLPIELAQGETLVSLDGIDDVESSGGNGQEGEETAGKEVVQNLEEVATTTGEVIRLKKPRKEEKCGKKAANEKVPVTSTVASPSHPHSDDASFSCTLCSQRFTRKLYLNNHMEEQHGVKYVFTERGRKVKLVRIPKNYDPQNMGNLDPSLRKLIKRCDGREDLSKIVGVVSVPDPDSEEAMAPLTETAQDSLQGDGEKEDEEGVECGFLVDRINTLPYQKAIESGEVPFCAFAPISTKDLYLLRIQDCSDTTRHMLVPASKEEVFNIPGALKIMDDEQEPGNEDNLNYRVAIVAVARQIYSEEDKQLVVSVEPLLKKDKKNITCVRFLTLDKFADFAFLGFDGNISEFVTKTEAESKDNRRSSSHQSHLQQSSSKRNSACSPPPLSGKVKSPPKAPTRRGRGGRRRVNRKSPPMPSPHHQGHGQCIFQVPAGGAHQLQSYPGSFQTFHSTGPFNPDNNYHSITIVKMDDNGQTQQFVTQVPVSQFQDAMASAYAQDTFAVPIQLMQQDHVPVPVNEITVSTTDAGSEAETQQVNHDILTIAFDQLANMTNVGEQPAVERGTTSGRGGRRPGRKPGRKPAVKEKLHQEIDENTTFGQLLNFGEIPVGAPKRRGRPPKNRLVMQIAGHENDHPVGEGEDAENLEKRVKLQIFE